MKALLFTSVPNYYLILHTNVSSFITFFSNCNCNPPSPVQHSFLSLLSKKHKNNENEKIASNIMSTLGIMYVEYEYHSPIVIFLKRESSGERYQRGIPAH